MRGALAFLRRQNNFFRSIRDLCTIPKTLKNALVLLKDTLLNLIFAVVITLILYFLKLTREYSVIEISATLLGFTLTALGIFFALPMREEIRERVKQFQYDKIVAIILIMAMIAYLLNIIVYLFVDFFYINIFFLLFGLGQNLISTYYIFNLYLKGC